MKLVTLIENFTACCELQSEHGLSLYLEIGDQKVLFDAGQSAAFADNAVKLGIDLTAVDAAILSHGHYDHGGGLKCFREINPEAPIYLSRHAFGVHKNAGGKDIGLDRALMEESNLIFVDDSQEIAPGLTLYSCNDRLREYATDTAGMTADAEPETFLHEQYLLIEEAQKRILISGCSHKGILNIVRWFQPDILIGGFHFMKIQDEDTLKFAAETLMAYPTVYYTGHCTGEEQFAFLKQIMGSQLHRIETGTELEF